jgi:hypothetical protein
VFMRAVLSTILLVAVAACGQSPTAPSDPATPADLRSAPTSLTLDGRRIVLATSLWRDFMPISPPDGQPLVAVARVKADDGSPLPVGVRATDLWVVFDEALWHAAPKEERARADTAPDYEVVARAGPKWGPGVTVHVVLRLTDGHRTWLLRAPNQPIVATF